MDFGRRKKQALYVVKKLHELYPDAHCELHHSTPEELLVATVLSAQCTDKRVNKVTKVFFSRYKIPQETAKLDVKLIEKEIKSTGFYRNKAKNIKALSEILMVEYDGEIPNNLKSLVKLPGVGRKTANVILGEVFNKPEGVVVDTHVRRLSNHLGLTEHQNPEVIERDLIKVVPKKHWVRFSHWMIFHGRRLCKARNPDCKACPLKRKCYYYVKQKG